MGQCGKKEAKDEETMQLWKERSLAAATATLLMELSMELLMELQSIKDLSRSPYPALHAGNIVVYSVSSLYLHMRRHGTLIHFVLMEMHFQ